MRINSEKKKTLIILVVIVIFIVGSVFFVINPIVKKVYYKKDLIEERKIALEKERSNFTKYQADLEFLEDELIDIQDLNVYKENKVELIELLERTATEEGLVLDIESYKKPASSKIKKQESSKVFLKISSTGSYNSFLRFIYRLENFKYPIGLEGLSVKSFDDFKKTDQEEFADFKIIPEIKGEIIISFN
jgi:hypothetical protein